MFNIVENSVGSSVGSVKSPYGSYRLIKDKNGRQYRVGERPEDITKKVLGYKISRRTMVIGAWMCFFFGSVLEYGWGSASTLVISHYGWSTVEGFFNYTVYVLFEATVAAYIFSRLREKGLLSLRRMLWLGSALLIISCQETILKLLHRQPRIRDQRQGRLTLHNRRKRSMGKMSWRRIYKKL